MAASLTNLCLLAVRDAVESGRVRNIHMIPPHMRQLVLDLILLNGTINEPKCLKAVGSVEFLSGFTCLNTQQTRGAGTDDHAFLDIVVDRMATVLPNGETIGSAIRSLALNLYGGRRPHAYHPGRYDKGPLNTMHIIQLIAKCPQLKSLNLGTVWTDIPATGVDIPESSSASNNLMDENWMRGGLLNLTSFTEPCVNVLKNLNELTVRGMKTHAPILLHVGFPIIPLKNLTRLEVIDCDVHPRGWRQLLNHVEGTLTSLQLRKLRFPPESAIVDEILPFPMQKLKELMVDEGHWGYQYTQAFVEKLARCEALERVTLSIDGSVQHWDPLESLKTLKATVHVNIRLVIRSAPRPIWGPISYNPNDLIDESSQFRLVKLFGENIKYVEIMVRDLWNPQFTSALAHLTSVCVNLTRLEFVDHSEHTNAELQNAKMHMAALFQSKERAMKFRKIKLHGSFDEKILWPLFENCLNVDSFSMAQCPQLWDEHLIDWIRRGARPSKFILNKCGSVTDEGLIAVIVNSGNRLRVFGVYGDSQHITHNTRRALNEHCIFTTMVELPKNTNAKDTFYQMASGFA